jgi:type VI secretion system protein VasG
VDIEHYLLKLLEQSNTDLHRILEHFGIDVSRISGDLTSTIDGFKVGNARTPALSPHIPQMLSDAWLVASIDLSAPRIRSGHLVLALLSNDELARLIKQSSKQFELIEPEVLRKGFGKIVAGSDEELAAETDAAEPETTGVATGTKALEQFTVDLTARARKGDIDPIVGRDFEIRQIVDILTRRRQNNPILTGEAGVGKTAVAEGLALRIAAGDVPAPLKTVILRTLDLGLLQAGAGIKGEFENRLKSVMEEVKGSPKPVILFIDEAHTMIGAGGQAGQSDAANLLKPALARGELRTIAATTWSEYKKYFEKDPALARRFQVVKIEEPTPEAAVVMMRHISPTLEQHHNVRILDEAVEASVNLSHRYISGRQLPDKSVSVLDTACARLAMGQAAVPGSVEDHRRRVSATELEIEILEREQITNPIHQERLAGLGESLEKLSHETAALEARWDKEKGLIEAIRELREQIEAAVLTGESEATGEAEPGAEGAEAPPESAAPGEPDPKEPESPTPSVEELQSQLGDLRQQLTGVQEEDPLMQVVVSSQTVADVVSGWTGIPVGKMMRDEINTVLSLDERLQERVLGQDHALRAIAQRIQTSRARMEDPRRPIGVFMLVGPSGVGKTETALALADTLYGGEQNLITINMSEYQEAHTVSSLKGSPPGYVGYGEGGVLTEAVRRKPYSVVLLDEVEKAHSDVMELFFQVFDKGMLEDGEGREIDFKNTVIILTSNAGTDKVMKLCGDEETRPLPEGLAESLRPDLQEHFKPAFLGRLIVIPYYPISDEVMRLIIGLQLGRIKSRIRQNHRAEFSFDESLIEAIQSRCTEVDSGARNVDHILTRTLLPEISREVLSRMAEDQEISSIRVSTDKSGAFQYDIS